MAQYAVPTPVTIAGLDINNETGKAGLKAIVIDSANNVRDYTPLLYKKNTVSNELTFKKKVYAGLPRAQSWSHTTGNIATGSMQFLWDVDATHAWYGLAHETTLEQLQFDAYKINPKIPKELGKGVMDMKQYLSADFFNAGFTTNWEDGVPFFSASHPYNTSYSAGVQSNLVTGTVSVAMAADAINKLINQRDPMGRPLGLRPARLFCYPTAVMLWKQVLSATAEYGTANRNDSPFGDFNIEVVPYPHFDSTTPNKWFLQADDYEVYYSEPVGIQTSTKETDSHARRIESWFAIAYWAEKWQGYVGGLGT